MKYKQLKELFCRHESGDPQLHLTAYITFSSFGPASRDDHPWKNRTYVVSSNNKAFQSDKGGCSIFGCCLDGSDPSVRLEKFMREEHGGADGWEVEDCCIVSYLLIECSKFDISEPVLFHSRENAAKYMLSLLAVKGELNPEQIKKDYAVSKEIFEEDLYGADTDSAG